MSAPIQAFDPLTVPIAGTNLIEASAGTGKTYGIAALFTRLIVLEQKNVERVLVVTFTKAATAELKTRLRARLDDVLQVLESKEIAKLGDDTLSDGIAAYCAEHHKGDTFLPALLKQAYSSRPPSGNSTTPPSIPSTASANVSCATTPSCAKHRSMSN
ncbi:uvrD/REP helicase N-terminal domain protein [Neisseria meningitidis NM151]|nr:uvrD/REP helicase N-terminal domain protein [Neisseria meningitidis NM151]